MKILIDILHPAHVHFFRNFIELSRDAGHQVLITAREKECVRDLLDQYGLPYTVISSQSTGITGLAREMVSRSYKLWKIARKFDPDFMTGIMGPSIAVVGKLLRSKTVIFYDTEMAKITNWFAYPLADAVCTPSCYTDPVRGRHITYEGYHELAYLHPDRFTPDFSVVKQLGIAEGETYFLLRFVSWQASHDLAEHGLTTENKYRLVKLLQEHGRVLISSEAPLPDDLQPLVVTLPASEMHHVMAFAGMLVGESATMCSECAVLGVPSVYIAKTSRGYIDEQEKRYGLVHIFTHTQQQEACDRARELAADPDRAVNAAAARKKLLADKIDVTAWMAGFFADSAQWSGR